MAATQHHVKLYLRSHGQGTVLGPMHMLFLIYINDLSTDIQSTIRLFAQMIVLFIEQYILLMTTMQLLQQDINTLTNWVIKWQMQFIVNKCSILQLSKYIPIFHGRQASQYHWTLLLRDTNIDHHLSWIRQVELDCVCKKAARLMGFFQRNLQNCPIIIP